MGRKKNFKGGNYYEDTRTESERKRGDLMLKIVSAILGVLSLIYYFIPAVKRINRGWACGYAKTEDDFNKYCCY
jgi:hypothetical protein